MIRDKQETTLNNIGNKWTMQQVGRTMGFSEFVPLSYRGIVHPRYRIYQDGRLYLRFRGRFRPVTLHCRKDGYREYRVKHPRRGRNRRIIAHTAVLESFTGIDPQRPFACHKPGTQRSDIYLGCCEWGTSKENRSHRGPAGTASTGRYTQPGKLTLYIDELLRDYDNGYSKEDLEAKYDWVIWKTIRNRLRQHGRISLGERV